MKKLILFEDDLFRCHSFIDECEDFTNTAKPNFDSVLWQSLEECIESNIMREFVYVNS